MTSITTKKIGYDTAKLWRNALYNSGNTDPVLYVFIGNHIPYANESSPDSIVDTISSEKAVWNNMYAAKRMTGNDVELVVPKMTWTANTKYREYDDTVDLATLVTQNTASGYEPIYVINSERNVYMCLNNNASANSTIEPTGKNISANGIVQTADNYLWKYLYNVRASNRFLSNNWIPVPVNTSKLDYDTSSYITVEGELAKIVTTNIGSGSTGYLKLQWQGATNSEIIVVTDDSFDYSGEAWGGVGGGTFPNPEASSNGDILITTTGVAAGDAFTVFIDLKKDGRDFDQGQARDPAAFNYGPYSK